MRQRRRHTLCARALERTWTHDFVFADWIFAVPVEGAWRRQSLFIFLSCCFQRPLKLHIWWLFGRTPPPSCPRAPTLLGTRLAAGIVRLHPSFCLHQPFPGFSRTTVTPALRYCVVCGSGWVDLRLTSTHLLSRFPCAWPSEDEESICIRKENKMQMQRLARRWGGPMDRVTWEREINQGVSQWHRELDNGTIEALSIIELSLEKSAKTQVPPPPPPTKFLCP